MFTNQEALRFTKVCLTQKSGYYGRFAKRKLQFSYKPGTTYEENAACLRISTRKFVWTTFANKFFVSRSDFREVNPVVRLVHSIQLDLQAFFSHRDLDVDDVQLISVWTLVSGMCRMAF